MSKYKVDVMRINYAFHKGIVVEADSSRVAKAKAMREAKNYPANDESVEYEIDDCLLIQRG